MRTYKKKNPGINADNVKEALKAVENKIMSQRAACKAFNVTRKTLYRRLKEKHHLPNYPAGMKSSLPFDSEVELAVALTTLAKQGFALTRTEVRQLVKEYVEKHKKDNNQIGEHLRKYCQFKNNCPGNDWMTKFLKKFKLSSKKPSSLEKSRLIASQDPEIIFGFYDNLEKQMLTLGIINKPKNIYNLDETNMCVDPQNTKVIAPSGKKVTGCTSTSGRENVSVLATVNAAGECLPPLVIFPAKSLWTSFKGIPNLEYPGTMYAKSNKGWMTAEVFTEWFNKFCLQVKERPLLLIYDGHSSHVCYNIITKAREENITILKLPPHTTDCLQPLDVACFKTFHSVWDAKLIDYYRRIGAQRLTKGEVVDLLGQVWEKGINTNNIISGFEKTGIYPVNRHRYPSEKFNKYLMAKYNHNILLGSGNVHLMVNPPSLNEALVMEIQLPSSHETSTHETSIPEIVALDQAPSTSSSVPALIDEAPSVPALIDEAPSTSSSVPALIDEALSVPALIEQAPINTSTDESPYTVKQELIDEFDMCMPNITDENTIPILKREISTEEVEPIFKEEIMTENDDKNQIFKEEIKTEDEFFGTFEDPMLQSTWNLGKDADSKEFDSEGKFIGFEKICKLVNANIPINPLTNQVLQDLVKSEKEEMTFTKMKLRSAGTVKYAANKISVCKSYLDCSDCERRFHSNDSSESLSQHIGTNHEETLLPSRCSHCLKVFRRKIDLSAHIKKSHIMNTFRCYLCEQIFGLKTELYRHMHVSHADVKTFECPRCEKKFYREKVLALHIQSVHEKLKPYKCSHCSRCFGLNYNLLRHIKSVHVKSKAVKCITCAQTFAYHSDMLRHVKLVHEKLKPFICYQCNKAFGSKGDLSRHTKLVHLRSYKFTCQHCDKVFHSREYLFTHIRSIHEITKPNKCLECYKSFSFYANLCRHIRTVHKKLKPCKCLHCEFRCQSMSYLRKHKSAVHDKLKPHKCSFCEKSFANKIYLPLHIQSVHKKLKPFKCYHCDKSFGGKPSLIGHIQNVHFKIK